MTITTELRPETFALLCFCVLMETGGGILDMDVLYINEKRSMIMSGHNAFGFLDANNQAKVRHWHKKWGFAMPHIIM